MDLVVGNVVSIYVRFLNSVFVGGVFKNGAVFGSGGAPFAVPIVPTANNCSSNNT